MEQSLVEQTLGDGFPSSERHCGSGSPSKDSTSSSDETSSEEAGDETYFDEVIDISDRQSTRQHLFLYSSSKKREAAIADDPIATSSSDSSEPWHVQEDRASRLGSALTTSESTNNNLVSELRIYRNSDKIYLVPNKYIRQSEETDELTAIANLSRPHQEQYQRVKLLYSLFALNPDFRSHVDPFNIMDPRSHGLWSIFAIESQDMIKQKPGGQPTDITEWTVGFDPRLFIRGLRNLNIGVSVACPYKVRGQYCEYELYCNQASQWGRRRIASERIEPYLNPEQYQSQVAGDFALITQAFFGGREVPENTEILKDDGTKHHITYRTSEFSKILQENPLQDKQLMCFLQDCAMATTYEDACFPKKDTIFGNLKAFRADDYAKIKKLVDSADFDDVTIEFSRDTLQFCTDTEASTRQVKMGFLTHGESEVAKVGDVKPAASSAKQKKRKDHRSKKNKSKSRESKDDQSHWGTSCEQNTGDHVTDCGTNNIESEELKEKKVSDDHPADDKIGITNSQAHPKEQQPATLQSKDEAKTAQEPNAIAVAPNQSQLITEPSKAGKNAQPAIKHDDSSSGWQGKLDSDTVTHFEQASSRVVDDSSSSFEAHDHLLSHSGQGADETKWEVVKPKSFKTRGGPRRGNFGDKQGNEGATQPSGNALNMLTYPTNPTYLSPLQPRGGYQAPRFFARRPSPGHRQSFNGSFFGSPSGPDSLPRASAAHRGVPVANNRRNGSFPMATPASQLPSNTKVIVPEKFPALRPKPNPSSIYFRESQSEAADDQFEKHASEGNEKPGVQDISTGGTQTSKDILVAHTTEVGKSDSFDGRSEGKGTSGSPFEQIHNVTNFDSVVGTSEEAMADATRIKSEQDIAEVAKSSSGNEVEASPEAPTVQSIHETLEERRLDNVVIGKTNEAGNKIHESVEEFPLFSTTRNQEDGNVLELATSISVIEDKSEGAFELSVEEVDPESQDSIALIKEKEKQPIAERSRHSLYEGLSPSLDGMVILDDHGQSEAEYIHSPTLPEHLISPDDSQHGYGGVPSEPAVSRATTQDDEAGTIFPATDAKYKSAEAPYFHQSAGQDQPPSNSLHTINTPQANLDDIPQFKSGSGGINMYAQQQPWNLQLPPLRPNHMLMYPTLPYQYYLNDDTQSNGLYLNGILPPIPHFPSEFNGYHGGLAHTQNYMIPNHTDSAQLPPTRPVAPTPPPMMIDGYPLGARSGPQSITDGLVYDFYHTQPERQIRSGQRTPSSSAIMAFNCSSCHRARVGSLSAPMVLCPGCGPKCNIRYCSVACLLTDAYRHWGHCMKYPACQQMRFYDLPDQFVYEKDPIVGLDSYFNNPEQSRQQLFSMCRRFRAFPTIPKKLTKEDSNGIETPGSQQQTGDYYVFKSDATAIDGEITGTQVIYTLALRDKDHVKATLQRALNACYLLPQRDLLEYLFRLIRYYILHNHTYHQCPSSAPSNAVIEEFKRQFSKEFAFNVWKYEHESTDFDPDVASSSIIPYLEDMEMRYPILRYWIGR